MICRDCMKCGRIEWWVCVCVCACVRHLAMVTVLLLKKLLYADGYLHLVPFFSLSREWIHFYYIFYTPLFIIHSTWIELDM